MRHATAEELADWEAGRLREAAARKVASHVETCVRCGAREAMGDIRTSAAPELGWDHIAARIYWVTSSEEKARRRARPQARRVALAGIAVAALGGAVGYLAFTGTAEAPTTEVAELPPAPVVAPAPAPAPALAGVVTFLQGEVKVAGRSTADPASLDFDRAIGPGDRLSTGAGRVTVQLGAGFGFSLGPESRVTLSTADHEVVELALDGELAVEVSHRRPDQVFAVLAGDRRVEVRGTRFEVARSGARLAVACTRGEVVVRDASGEVAVPAGQTVALEPGSLVAQAEPRAIDPERLARLERTLAMPLLPAWTNDGRSLQQTSTAIDIAAAHAVPVTIDGLVVGEGEFRVRVMSGRHHVQAGGDAPRWIEADAERPIAVELGGRPAPAPDEAGVSEARKLRKGQLERALTDHRAARQCLSSLEKQGLVGGSFATFEIGVDERGRKAHLNVVASNLPPELERCLQQVVDGIELPPGPPVTVRYKLAF